MLNSSVFVQNIYILETKFLVVYNPDIRCEICGHIMLLLCS